MPDMKKSSKRESPSGGAGKPKQRRDWKKNDKKTGGWLRASRQERRVKACLPSLVILLSANHARNILVDT
jgi:hypothetical protein